MNKLFENIINIVKAFIPFFIYYFLSIVYAIIIRSTNTSNSEIILALSELLTLIPLVLFFWKKIKKDFVDFDNNYKKYLSIAIKSYIIGFTIMIFSNYFISRYFISTQAANEVMNELILIKYPFYSIVGMILIGPFIEELAFRLGFKKYIKNKFLYYFFSVLLFAGIHTLNGISSPIELLYFLPYGAMACSFSYTLDKTDNIFSTVVMHTLHNTFTIVIILLGMLLGG